MSAVTTSLYTMLNSISNLTSITDRIYPESKPLNVDPPFVTYSLDFDQRQQLMDGTESDYRRAIMTVDCYALDLITAMNMADAVEQLVGWVGPFFGSITVDHLRLERRGPHLFETDTELYRVPLELLIGYEE